MLTQVLSDVVNWNIVQARDAHLAAHPGGRYATSHMRLAVATTLSLTLLELWSLVKEGAYIHSTGMLLLAVSVALLDRVCEGWGGFRAQAWRPNVKL